MYLSFALYLFQVNVPATASQPASSYRSTESFRFLVRWCFFACGLTPAYLIAWYIMHVLVVLVEKGGLFAQQRVVYFVIGMRVRILLHQRCDRPQFY